MRRRVIVGTRASALARTQTNSVVDAIRRLENDIDIEIRLIKTEGDADQVRPLAEVGGLGVFTKALEDALLNQSIDIAVHSLKDLPTEIAPGLAIAAIPERADARDCMVSRTGMHLSELPVGARVGTSSARRSSQVRALRPDVNILALRGNVDTRLRKLHSGEYDAIILAAAGISRLHRLEEISEFIPTSVLVPDPGQGALAVEVRTNDAEVGDIVSRLDHGPSRAAVTAERAFLRALGGGCRMPIGAFTEQTDGSLHLRGMVSNPEGTQMLRGEIRGAINNPAELGTHLACQLLVRGADTILDIAPLKGVRVLITRAADQAPALAAKLQHLGAETIEFPTIEVAPLQDYTKVDAALSCINEYDWLIFTSVNGVQAILNRLAALGKSIDAFSSTRLAAIGPATARALEESNLRVQFVPTRYLGTQVAAELPATLGQKALLFRADIASRGLEQGLVKRGVLVDNVDAYRTVLPSTPDLDLRRIDAITFTSSSTVRNFCLLHREASESRARTAVFCIGPVTEATAREQGLHVTGIANEHTIDGLVEIVLRHYISS